MNRIAVLALFSVLASPLAADEVALRSGQKLSGMAREDGDKIVVEMAMGSVSVDRGDVLSITKGETPMHVYAVRAEAAKETADFVALLAFARENKLSRYLAALNARILELDPDNAQVRKEMGQVKVDGKWVAQEPAKPRENSDAAILQQFQEELEKAKKLEAMEKKLDGQEKKRQAAEEKERKKQVVEKKPREVAAEDDIDIAKARELGLGGSLDIEIRPLGLGFTPRAPRHHRHFSHRFYGDDYWGFYFAQRAVWGCPDGKAAAPSSRPIQLPWPGTP